MYYLFFKKKKDFNTNSVDIIHDIRLHIEKM